MKNYYRTELTDRLMMLAGVFLAGLAYSLFFIPGGIAPGGLGGLSVIISEYVPVGAGLITLLLNVPVFIFADRVLKREFVIKTGVLLVIMSVIMDILPALPSERSVLADALCGGVLLGIGLGTVMFAGASTGGTDTLALTLGRKFPALRTERALFLLDAGVVLLSAATSGAKKAVYSAAAVAVQMLMINFVRKIYSKRILPLT